MSPALQADSLLSEPPGEPNLLNSTYSNVNSKTSSHAMEMFPEGSVCVVL